MKTWSVKVAATTRVDTILLVTAETEQDACDIAQSDVRLKRADWEPINNVGFTNVTVMWAEEGE